MNFKSSILTNTPLTLKSVTPIHLPGISHSHKSKICTFLNNTFTVRSSKTLKQLSTHPFKEKIECFCMHNDFLFVVTGTFIYLYYLGTFVSSKDYVAQVEGEFTGSACFFDRYFYVAKRGQTLVYEEVCSTNLNSQLILKEVVHGLVYTNNLIKLIAKNNQVSLSIKNNKIATFAFNERVTSLLCDTMVTRMYVGTESGKIYFKGLDGSSSGMLEGHGRGVSYMEMSFCEDLLLSCCGEIVNVWECKYNSMVESVKVEGCSLSIFLP